MMTPFRRPTPYYVLTMFLVCAGIVSAVDAPAGSATDALQEDWLYQAGGTPTLSRTIAELLWTEELADRLQQRERPPDLSAERAALADIRSRIGQVVPIPDDVPEDEGGGEFTVARADSRLAAGGAVDYTLCCWIRTNGGVMDVLGTGVSPGDCLLVVNRGPVRAHHFTTKSPNAMDGKIRVTDGRWHHIAQTVSDGRLSLFVDGRLDVSTDVVGDITVSGKPVYLGTADNSAGRRVYRFRGELKDFELVPKALSADTLRDLYQRNVGRFRDADKERRAEKIDVLATYLDIREVKRAAFMKDPLVDFDKAVFVDVPCYDALNHESMHRVFPQAQNNVGRLMTIDGLRPQGRLTDLAQRRGMFWRPDVSFDGERVLFCMRPEGERTFHLYEVGVDGNGMRQITHGLYDDLDPVYSPDGNIMFLSNRGNSYARCAVAHPSYVVSRCDANGKNLYLLSMSNEPEYTPCLLPDGRIMYTRWEYTDKELMRIQSLWTMNPDGTGVATLWGNQSTWPDMLVEARPIPGSRRIIFSGQGHHNIVNGSIGMVDPALGLNYPDGLTRVTWERPWAEVGNGPAEKQENPRYHASGRFDGYRCPYPLSEELFLVSARRSDRRRFSLYLMDVWGNRELVHHGQHDVLYAMPVRPREHPQSIPDRIRWPGSERAGHMADTGVLYSSNVLEGLPDEVRDKAKYVRVIHQDYTTFTYGLKCQMPDYRGVRSRGFHQHAGPPVTITGNDGIKRILGTVPIANDGSVAIEVPPSIQIHFQLLDDKYRALHIMRSFTGVMPGEKRGCVGCHEMHSKAPAIAAAIATRDGPVKPTPPPWGARYHLGYRSDIQPILDRHCGRCHQGTGKGREHLDMTFRPSPDSGSYAEPYVTLVLGAKRRHSGGFTHGCDGGPAGALLPMVYPLRPEHDRTLPPLTAMSFNSKLVKHAISGTHHDVKADAVSARKLVAWVDLLCPYWNEDDIRSIPDPDPADPFFAQSAYPPRTPGVKPFADSPYPPRMQNAPVVNRAYCQDEFPTQADRLRVRGREGGVHTPSQ